MGYILDEIDKRILFELDKNARIAEVKLAKKIGKSKEATRYRIKKLLENNFLKGYTIWIDPIKLGFQTAKLYLTLANIPQKKKMFIEQVSKDPRLFWMGIAEGAWNAGLTYFVHSNQEFFKIKNELFTKYKDLILESHTASVVGIYLHDKTFLYNSETDWTDLFTKSENYELDNISKKILMLLLNNGRENIATIATKTNITVDKVRTRIKSMEEKGIIKRYTAIIDYEKLGYEFYKTFLYFKNLDDSTLISIMNFCKNNKNIIHLVKQISPWDIELEIMCKNFVEYNEIISNLTQQFSNSIQKVETAIMKEDNVFPSKKLIFN